MKLNYSFYTDVALAHDFETFRMCFSAIVAVTLWFLKREMLVAKRPMHANTAPPQTACGILSPIMRQSIKV